MEKSPSSPAFFPLASLLWQQGDGPRAEKLLRSGLGVHPAYAAPRVLLGEVLLAMDRPEEAAEELAAAVGKSPWNLQGQRLLAECRKRAGDEAGARRALRLAAMFDPSNPESRALLEEAPRPAAPAARRKGAPASTEAEAPAPIPTPSLAQLYTSQGHHAQAAEVYRQLLEKEPGNAEWRKQLGLLEARLAGGKKAAPPAPAPAPAGGGFDMDFEEELAGPAEGVKAGIASPGDSDLDALLNEADRAGSSLPALEEEDEALALPESAEKAGAPGGMAGGAAPEDDLESFLAEEDESAGAAPAPRAAAAPDVVLDEDLESLFAEEEGEAESLTPQAAPRAAPAAGSAPDVVLDEDLENLFADEEGEAESLPLHAAPPAAGGAEAAAGEIGLEAMFAEEGEGAPAAAAPAVSAASGGDAAPDAVLDEDLEGLFAEEGAEGELVPAPAAAAPAGVPADELSDELDLDALFEEEGGAPAAASAPGADPGVIPDDELEGLLAEADAAAAPPAVEPVGTGGELDLDMEVELEEGDLGLVSEELEPGGADETEELVSSAGGEAARPASPPGPERAPRAEEVEVAPVLRSLIGLYVEEGNLAQALDLCRKASAVGAPSGWLTSRMQEIEGQLAAGARLQESGKGDKEGEVRSLSPAEVVERLEGWLQTLQRRKAGASANQ